jgi:HAMP domain-containing protein
MKPVPTIGGSGITLKLTLVCASGILLLAGLGLGGGASAHPHPVTLLVLGLALLGACVFAIQIIVARPLRHLLHVARQQLADDPLAQRHRPSADEFGELARALRALTTQSNRKTAKLRDANEQLRREVTDHECTAHALKHSETRLKTALEAGRMGIWEWEIATGLVQWSPEVEHAHGLDTGAFAGRFEDFQALVHADDWPGLLSAVREALEQCVIDYSMEYRLAAAPDRWIGAHGRVFFDAAGQPEHVGGVFRYYRAQTKRADSAGTRSAPARNRSRTEPYSITK